MPTIIDSLIIELGFETTKLPAQRSKAESETKRLRDNFTSAGKEIEGSTKRGVEMFSALRKEVLSLLAVFTAGVGIQQFVKNVTESDAAVGRMSEQLNVSTEELSAWQGVMRRNGGTAADATSALGTITNAYEEFITTGKTSLPYLSLLSSYGVSFSDFKNPSDALLKIGDALHKIAQIDPARAALIGRSLGFSPEAISVLIKGGAAIRQQLEEQKKLGTVSKEQADHARKLQNAFSSLTQASTNLGRQLLFWLAPAMDTVNGFLVRAAEWANTNGPVVQGAFVGLATAAVGLGIALAAPVAPFMAVAGAAALVGGWFASIITQSPELQAGVKELTKDAAGFASAVVELARELGLYDDTQKDAFGPQNLKLGKIFFLTLIDLADALVNSLKLIVDVLTGHWSQAWQDAKNIGNALVDHRLSDISAGRTPDAPPQSTAPQASTGTPAQRAKAFFLSRGYSDAQADGLVAGAVAESKLNPGAVNPKSGAFGIGQWLGARKDELFRRYGRNPTFDQQLAFIDYELSSGSERQVGSEIRSKRSSQGVLDAYIKRYMRPGFGAETSSDLSRGGAYLAANQNVQSLPTGASAAALFSGGGGSKTTVQIDNIVVNTRATDSKGIADSIGPAIRDRTFVPQANRGLG